jgi:hypothetical protein
MSLMRYCNCHFRTVEVKTYERKLILLRDPVPLKLKLDLIYLNKHLVVFINILMNYILHKIMLRTVNK